MANKKNLKKVSYLSGLARLLVSNRGSLLPIHFSPQKHIYGKKTNTSVAIALAIAFADAARSNRRNQSQSHGQTQGIHSPISIYG